MAIWSLNWLRLLPKHSKTCRQAPEWPQKSETKWPTKIKNLRRRKSEGANSPQTGHPLPPYGLQMQQPRVLSIFLVWYISFWCACDAQQRTSAEREAIHSKSDTHHPSHTRTINKKSFVAASLSRSFSLARALSLCSVTRQECRPNLHSSSSLLPLNKPSSSAPSRSSVTVEKRNIIHSACKSARPRSAENF